MQHETPTRSGGLGRYVAYVVMLALGVGGFLAIRHFGAELGAPRPAEGDTLLAGTAMLRMDALMHLLLALAVIIITARGLAWLCVKLNQPAFFAYTGMRTQVSLLNGASTWLWCGIVLATASAGKFGGSFVAARLSGLGWRDAASIGILMNTRGLVELIVLNIGLDLKVISPTLFAMLVLMAVITTVSTTPILHAIGKLKPALPTPAPAPASLTS